MGLTDEKQKDENRDVTELYSKGFKLIFIIRKFSIGNNDWKST